MNQILQSITLINFRNHREISLDFSPAVNVIAGRNGVGKTAILDAIHYLCLCKSYFNSVDYQQIQYERDAFIINGKFDCAGSIDTIVCSVKRHQKKIFKRNQHTYDRLADHVGLFPLVVISPNDVNLIVGGSEDRRRFMDNVIAQTDKAYLCAWIDYGKTLLNRNMLLKKIADTKQYDPEWLAIYDEKLGQLGQVIFTKRNEFIAEFIALFDPYYRVLSDAQESVSVTYQSQLHDTAFDKLLRDAVEKDRLTERTTCGIHRDELYFSIADMPLKKFASQGQQKTFSTALKLAQYAYLKQKRGVKPILLLDDIFDKLDNKRLHKLMQLVTSQDFGQLFITDTEIHRTLHVIGDIDKPIQSFDLNNEG